MRIVALGVRGSTPAPGPDFVRYGGHTSCLAVLADGADRPHLVLDAGTGLSTLPDLLGDAPFEGQIVLTHLHWDHMQGLPFCRSIDRADAHVTLHVPVDDPGTDPVALLERGFSPPLFPIRPTGLLGTWTYRALSPGRPDDVLTVASVAHKGGITFAVRVDLDGAALVYVPDHALHATTTDDDLAPLRGLLFRADLLLHDGQFESSDQSIAAAYGHATIERVLDLADECAVGRLIFTHHGPTRTDDALDGLTERFTRTPGGRPVAFARQGDIIEIGRT